MRKLSLCIFFAAAAAFLLSGCGLFNKDYVVIEDYVPTVQSESFTAEKITVSDIEALEQAISTIITSGETEGKIVFDAAYEGDPIADMSKACWQVRTQDALCAYCVEDISYELSKIVTYYEAKLSIGYTDYVDSVGSIIQLPYSTGIELIIGQALSEGRTKLVLLVDHSSYSAEDLVGLVSSVYRQHPTYAPCEPQVDVNMYSGSNMQRLYEVNMYYGLSGAELAYRKSCLDGFEPFSNTEFMESDDAVRALAAFDYIVNNCQVDNSGTGTYCSVYDALIGGKADSEGLALAYVELCNQLDVACIIVYGQHNWQEHCWNIIKVGDSYYHVDVGLSDSREAERCFMKTDEAFWENYRWDMSSYPACMPEPTTEEDTTPEMSEGDVSEPAEVQEEEISPDYSQKRLSPEDTDAVNGISEDESEGAASRGLILESAEVTNPEPQKEILK